MEPHFAEQQEYRQSHPCHHAFPLWSFYALCLSDFWRKAGLCVHNGKTLDKGVMLLFKFTVFKTYFLCLAVCLKQGREREPFSRLMSFRSFPISLSRAIISSSCLLLFRFFSNRNRANLFIRSLSIPSRGVYSFSGLSIISSKCLRLSVFSMSSFSSMFSKFSPVVPLTYTLGLASHIMKFG